MRWMKNYRRLKYVRYADDFLIGVIGSKQECERIKEDITNYMRDRLKLELSAEKDANYPCKGRSQVPWLSDNRKNPGCDEKKL